MKNLADFFTINLSVLCLEFFDKRAVQFVILYDTDSTVLYYGIRWDSSV